MHPAQTFVSGSSGSCTGNAATATTASKLGASTKGGSVQPIYLDKGSPVVCGRQLLAIAETIVTVNKVFAENEASINYAGPVPANNGYARCIGGYTGGDIMLCAPNRWMQNVKRGSTALVTNVTWVWLVS